MKPSGWKANFESYPDVQHLFTGYDSHPVKWGPFRPVPGAQKYLNRESRFSSREMNLLSEQNIKMKQRSWMLNRMVKTPQ